MKISPATLKRLEKLEAAAPSTGHGSWVTNCGTRVWDPWCPNDVTPEEAAATLERLLAALETTAERMRAAKDFVEPTPDELATTHRQLEEFRAAHPPYQCDMCRERERAVRAA